MEARVVNQPVDAPAGKVYDFAREMKNLPRWASGLAAGITEDQGRWFTESPMGRVEVRMAPRNDFGVLDHDVTLPDGSVTHNAFRVTPTGDGSMLSFVVLRADGADDAAFEKDQAHVADDLAALKKLMESA